MTDIQRLLNKTAWTGQDLGRLELMNMAVLFRQAITGQEQKPVVDREQFAKMVRTLTDSRQGQIYNGYIAVHEWISIHYNMAQTQLQQAQLQEQTLASYVTDALLAEDVYRYMEQLPLILTEEQYEKTARENLQKWLYLKPGLPKAEPLSALLMRGLNFYLRRLRESPSRANPLKRIRRAYRSQPVKSELLRSRYNAAAELGYYELEDGRRSDEMTQEEWQEATLPPPLLREMRGETGPDGQPLCDAVVQQYLLDRSRLVFAGYSEEEANRAQTRKDYEARLVVPRTWHAYPDPPETVYKWDVLTAKRGLSAFYGELFSPEPEDWEAYEREREDFFAEFPELIEALLADLETRFRSGETPPAADAPQGGRAAAGRPAAPDAGGLGRAPGSPGPTSTRTTSTASARRRRGPRCSFPAASARWPTAWPCCAIPAFSAAAGTGRTRTRPAQHALQLHAGGLLPGVRGLRRKQRNRKRGAPAPAGELLSPKGL